MRKQNLKFQNAKKACVCERNKGEKEPKVYCLGSQSVSIKFKDWK